MYSALIVEDSTLDRMIIARTLRGLFPQLEIRFASDPFEARDMILENRPSFLLLDIDLPRMSGGEFLGHLSKSDPMPVIIVSGQSLQGKERGKKLWDRGAAGVLKKPESQADLVRFRQQLASAIQRICPEIVGSENPTTTTTDSLPHKPVGESTDQSSPRHIIGIGASTGGPQALETIVSQLPVRCPPTLIAQHISETFIDSLVHHLNQCSQATVKIAEEGQQVICGHVYVASPASHVELTHLGRIHCRKRQVTETLTPSVDILFHSLARFRARTVFAALLTGMGNDGAEGLAAIRSAGGRTIAQDEATCAVFGMPARAIELDAAEQVLPIDAIYPQIVAWQMEVPTTRPAPTPQTIGH